MTTSASLSSFLDRLLRDPRDFGAYEGLVKAFEARGRGDKARALNEALARHALPAKVAATAPERLVDTAPLDREAVLAALREADPTTQIEFIAKVAGDYLDENLDDDEVQAALVRCESAYFAALLPRCQALHTRFRQRNYRLTCLVSTYASAAFIEECLDDLVAQTIFPDVEVLIIDACSPQNEAERARPYLERYDNIRYFITPERIGIYPAWTMGSMFATAPYITPLSTNDRLVANAYETLVNALDTHPAATLVYGDSYLTDKPHQRIGSHSAGGYYRWPDIDYGWLMLNCGVGPQPMWRKATHAQVGYFDRRYKATGDQEFFLRHARRNGLLHVPELTGMAWITNDSLSGHPSALSEALNIHVKHFKSVCMRVPLPARTEAWQILRRRYVEFVSKLPQQGCEKEALELQRRHGAFFSQVPV